MSDKVWAVIAIILLLIGLGGGYFIGLSAAAGAAKPKEELTGTIPIGVVMIGTVAPKEIPPQEKWLEEDLNSYIKACGKNFTVDLLIEYAQRSPTLALEKLQDLAAKGVKVALGFRWSSSVKAAMDYANEHKIVIISSGSTSPLLAIPNDYIFRLVPPDNLQAKALLAIHKNLGTKAVVLIYRGDAWGDGLAAKFKEFAPDYGIDVVGEVRYSTEATEFSGEASQLNTLVSQALSKYGNNVAVQTFSFSEIGTILQAASDYDTLMSVPWFGSDGYAGESDIIEAAGDLAVKTIHVSTVFAPTKSAKYWEFTKKFRSITGYDPLTYAYTFHDSAWIAVLAILQAGKYDGEAIKNVIPLVANNYFGVSGWTRLDENGDRMSAEYSIRFITRDEAGNPVWIMSAGLVDVSTGTVSWTTMPDLSGLNWVLPKGASTSPTPIPSQPIVGKLGDTKSEAGILDLLYKAIDLVVQPIITLSRFN